jgi:hypothetical protein
MPVSSSSRYAGLPVYDAINAHGQVRPTIAMRPPQPLDPDTSLYKHTLIGSETLEYLAWRYYGSSMAWWRIAEANQSGLVFPLDLQPGEIVAIASSNDVGRVRRTRSF